MIDVQTVVRFPIEKALTRERAEDIIGNFKMFKHPSKKKIKNPDKWLEVWLKSRFVLLGWDCVKRGLVDSFKSSKVRHVVAWARPNSSRPTIGTLCHVEAQPVYNWRSKTRITRAPAIVLAPEQEDYFRLCKNCEKKMRDMVRLD
jgi:hypothetical protein